MTASRVSAVWKLEQSFGVVDDTANYEYIGPGLDFNYQANNQFKFINAVGIKGWEAAAAGRFKGTFSFNTYLDYNTFKWLLMPFEEYSYDAVTGIHTFTKSNSKVLRSFTLRIKMLNRIVGGPADRTVVLTGCVANTLSLTYESSTSSIRAAVGGMYVNETLDETPLTDTDYAGTVPADIMPIEWGCVQIPAGTPIANTERVSVSVSNGVSTIASCGSRFDSAKSEGNLSITGSTTVYARNNSQWYQRVYSGGYDNTGLAPKAKYLRPIPTVTIASSYDSDGAATPAYSCNVTLSKVFVTDIRPTYSPGSELTDSPNYNAQGITIAIKSPNVMASLL